MDTYIHLLISNSAIAPCDRSFKEFVVQDFSDTTSALKVTLSVIKVHSNNLYLLQPYKYLFVTRAGHKFDDGKQWLYTCGCSIEHSRFVNSLSFKIRCKFLDFSMDYPNCIHINAVLHLLSQMDAMHYITPDMEFAGIVIVICINFVAFRLILM